MNGMIVVDANLLVLLVVGAASRSYITKHKRLQDYAPEDFDVLGLIIAQFDEIVLLPHALVEASNLARQIEMPARSKIQAALKTLISTVCEFPVSSFDAAQREEFETLGLTDAAILHFCGMSIDGICPTLLTSDSMLANRALALGYSAFDYSEFRAGH